MLQNHRRTRRSIVVALCWAMILGTLAWPRAAVAADPPPSGSAPISYNCIRDNLLIQSQLPCDYGTQTPDLINPHRLIPGLGADGGLYDATEAQRAALDRLQDQAIRNTLAQFDLPATDYRAVKSWARPEATAQLWSLIVEAIKTAADDRTPDQRLVVEWAANVLHRQRIAVAEQTAREYASWAGVDRAALDRLLATPGGPTPSTIATIKALFSEFPAAYSPHGGYCNYAPPAPFTNYTGHTDNTCFLPCTNAAGCSPPMPSFDEFASWGSARVNAPLLNDPSFVRLSRATIHALTVTVVAVSAIAVALAVTLIPTAAAIAVALQSTLLFTLISTALYSATATTVASVGAATAAGASVVGSIAAALAAAVVIVIVAIVVGVLKGIQVFEDEKVPGQIANLVGDAHASTVDMSAVGSDPQALTALFNLIIGAELPEPSMRSCDNSAVVNVGAALPRPCLNPTPIPAPAAGDVWFAVRREGSTAEQTGPTISTARSSMTLTSTSRTSGTWWINEVKDSFGNRVKVQSLIHYFTDWNGVDSSAWITKTKDRGYMFAVAPTTGPDGSPLNPSTCESEGKCRIVEEIRYLGADGNRYSARLVPPPVDVTPLTLRFDPVDSSFPVPWVEFTFSEPVTGRPSVTLLRDGQPIDMGSSGIVLPVDGREWTFFLSTTAPEGVYTFIVHGDSVRDRNGFPMAGGDQSIQWYRDALPTAAFDPIPAAVGDGLDEVSIVFSEPVQGVNRRAFQLTRDGVEVPLDSGVTIQQIGNRYVIQNLRRLTPAGPGGTTYRLSTRPVIADMRTNPVPVTSISFISDPSATASFDPIAPSDGLGQLKIRFSEPITGFNGTQLFMRRDGGEPYMANEIVVERNATNDVFNLVGLWRYARQPGEYTLMFVPSGSRTTTIRGTNGLPMTTTASVDFVIDRVGPTIVVDAPTPNQVVTQGATVTVGFRCDDPVGVTVCIGTTRNGLPLRTDTVGTQQLTVQAVDAAGNQSSVTVEYEVVPDPANVTTTLPETTTTSTTTTTTTTTTLPETTTTTTTTVTTVPDPDSDLVALHPARLLDTRIGAQTIDGQSAGVGTLGAGSVVRVPIAGRAGVPADATGVAINVTATETGGAGYLTVFPCAAGMPTTSTLNFSFFGQTVANAAIVALDDGDLCVAAGPASSEVVVDVTGFVPAASRYTPLAPHRALDTRTAGAGKPTAGSTIELDVGGMAGMPADAATVVLNLTATEPEYAGYVTAYDCGQPVPDTSSLAIANSGQTVANMVVAPVSATGTVCVFVASPAHLVVDVTGVAPAGSTIVQPSPMRLVDTRLDDRGANHETLAIDIGGRLALPVRAAAVLLNVTAVMPTGTGYVSVHACGAVPPLASNLNYTIYEVARSNTVLAPLDASATVCVDTAGDPTELIVDLVGVVVSRAAA